jgi:hypothetical protein
MALPPQTMTRSVLGPSSERSAHLFLVLECDRPLELPARYGLRGLDLASVGRGDARSAAIRGRQLELRVPDRRMSSSHARLSRLRDAWVIDDQGSKNGTVLNGRRVQHALLTDGDLIELGDTFLIYRSALEVPVGTPAILDGSQLKPPSEGIATMGLALGVDLGRLRSIAASRVPVLVVGETGTGKELVARAIHLMSGRKGSFQALNCAALAPAGVESELFGHRKNAFAGADDDRPGLVASASGGTLFLDEVGDLPLQAQGALLRVLQESEVLPLGATQPVKVDLRIVCATHQDLDALVSRGKLRADLLARLKGFDLTLPPLRERREDLGLIIAALLPKLAPERAGSISFGYEAARALLRYAWPANVRELERCLAAALVLAGDGVVRMEYLPEAVRELRPAPPGPSAGPPPVQVEPGFVAELKRRRVFRTMVAYGVATFALLQVIEPVMHGFHWPDEVLTYVVVALSLGFPLVVALAWIYDVNAGRIERTPPTGSAGPRRWQLALMLVATSLLAALPGLGWYLYVHVRAAPAAAPAPAPAPAPPPTPTPAPAPAPAFPNPPRR